jgi:hypothetical protein
MTVTNSGNIGIGTTSPVATLTASSTSSSVATAVFDQRGTGGLLTLQSSGVDKFVVANNGGLTIKGLDNSIVKTTSSDFAGGTVGSNLVNENGILEISDGTVPNSLKGTITTGGATLTSSINSGALAIARADGKYLILRGGGTTGMDVYDSVAGTFTASSQVTNGIISGGAQAFPRPGGGYRIVHGGVITTTSLIDPQGNVIVGSSATAAAASATGTVAFKRPDGRYIFTNGGAATTQLYDPVADTFIAGPAFGATAAKGSLVLPVASSTTGYAALFVVGGTNISTTRIYTSANGSAAGVNAAGAFAAGPDLGTGCEINGNGSVAIARQDGKYLVLSKANASSLYDPVVNTFTCRTSNGPGTALGDGAHAIPLQNGTFLVIVGGGSGDSYIYNPSTDAFTAQGTALGAISVGSMSILKQDGTWQILVGAGTATNNYDTGLVMGGNSTTRYTSEDISSSYLNEASTLRWLADLQAPMIGNVNATTSIRILIRTATNSGDCTTPLNNAIDKELMNSGDFIRASSTDNCIRITANFARPTPKKIFDDRGVFSGTGSGNCTLLNTSLSDGMRVIAVSGNVTSSAVTTDDKVTTGSRVYLFSPLVEQYDGWAKVNANGVDYPIAGPGTAPAAGQPYSTSGQNHTALNRFDIVIPSLPIADGSSITIKLFKADPNSYGQGTANATVNNPNVPPYIVQKTFKYYSSLTLPALAQW